MALDSAQLWDWIDATLDALSARLPDQARQARRALTAALRPVLDSCWPEAACSFSALAPHGVPIEFVWRPGEPSICWTSEVAGPECREEQRFALALRRLDNLGAPRPPASVIAAVEQAQQRCDLRWGAWIGGRHRPDGDSFKLYGETTGDGISTFARALDGMAKRFQRPSQRLVGANADGLVEIYGRVAEEDFGWLSALASDAGLSAQFRAAIDLASELTNRSLRVDLERSGAGWSLALRPGGELSAIAIFVKPNLFSSDPATSMIWIDRFGGCDPLCAIWRSLIGAGAWRPGLLGLAATHDGLRRQLAVVFGDKRRSAAFRR